MKKHLMASGALAAFIFSISSAHAQYNGKSSDDLSRETRYMQTDTQPHRSPVMAEPSYKTPASRTDTTPIKDSFEDFSGPYVGGDVSYAIGSYDVNDPTGADGDVGLDGFAGGLFVGYGGVYDFNWLGGYTGIELGYEWSDADGELGGNTFVKDHEWLVTVRPGITMHEDALAYGIIGYSRAKFEGNGDEDHLNGLVLGAGSEFSTRSPLKLRLEYTYSTYEDANLGGVSFDGNENQVKAGAVFRF
ncbi:MAG: porin family protein [Alphaproteobacteria bacterium]|nr:porin family protein [Alphaproteobacteria bacterium]